jgi:hypothetical protein
MVRKCMKFHKIYYIDFFKFAHINISTGTINKPRKQKFIIPYSSLVVPARLVPLGIGDFMCNEQNKKCKKCDLDKPISEYYFFNSKNRYSSQCKTCINIRNQKWKDNSREHHRAYCRKWNNDNKERKRYKI